MILVLIPLLISVAIFCIFLYARWNYGVLEALNIPVDNCSFLLGSTGDMHLKVQHYEDLRRFQSLGGIYGIYEGRQPVIFVADPDLIRLIFVKDANHFKLRREVDLGDPVINEMMDFLPYDKWQVVRHIMTPALSPSKTKKAMTEGVQDCVNDFLVHLKSKNREANDALRIDCRKTFIPFAIEILCRGLFGVKLEDPFNVDSQFTTLFRDLQGEDDEPNFIYSLSFSFPILTALAPFMSTTAASFFKNFFSNVIRGADAGSHENFLGRLQEMMRAVETKEYADLKITQNTVIGQAFSAFLPGVDGIATILTFFFHNLATYPEIQKKLHTEIDSARKTGIDLNYESVATLSYLSACLKETLRIAPPFIRPERICTEDWEHNGIRIPKGCIVMLPSWAVNRNPKIFDNPDEFNPDRFLDTDGNVCNPYGFNTFAFGVGPRNCIGEKFVMDVMKLAIANILHEFQFKLCDDAGISFKPGIIYFVQYKPVYLTVESRRRLNE